MSLISTDEVKYQCLWNEKKKKIKKNESVLVQIKEMLHSCFSFSCDHQHRYHSPGKEPRSRLGHKPGASKASCQCPGIRTVQALMKTWEQHLLRAPLPYLPFILGNLKAVGVPQGECLRADFGPWAICFLS